MSWLYLFVAIFLEVAGTLSVKMAQGFTQMVPSLLIFPCYAASIALVTLAVKNIEVGVAYAVWSGVGTVAITALGIMFFGETAGFWKIFFTALIIFGVIGLKLTFHE